MGSDNYILTVNGTRLSWQENNAITAPGGSDTYFQYNNGGTLSGNDALTFNDTSDILTVQADTTFDINSTNLKIADTDIELDGGATTLNGSNAITLQPANGSNLNIDLRGISDFIVDTDKFVVREDGNVHINTPSGFEADSELQIYGSLGDNSSHEDLLLIDRASNQSGSGGFIAFRGYQAAGPYGRIGFIKETGTTTTGKAGFAVYTGEAGTLGTAGNSTEKFRITNDGKFGMLTSSPAATLDLGGGTATTIDGTDDLLVKDDIEVDGDAYVEGNLSVGKTLVYDEEVNNGTSTSSDNIDWTAGNRQTITLGVATTTLTFTNPASTANLILRIVQDGTGSRVITWPASIKWPSATAPTLSTTASSEDIVTCYYSGTAYYCNATLDFAVVP